VGQIFRTLVLGVLWISVACFGLCGAIDLVNLIGRPSHGGENFSGIAAVFSGIALAILLPVIWLIRRFTGPGKQRGGLEVRQFESPDEKS
jgi:hypothetical protein